jgi:hypothetical protein
MRVRCRRHLPRVKRSRPSTPVVRPVELRMSRLTLNAFVEWIEPDELSEEDTQL